VKRNTAPIGGSQAQSANCRFLRSKTGKPLRVIIGDKALPKGLNYKRPRADTRIAEINRELTDRYGGRAVLPDDDAGRDDVELMLHHLARAKNARARIANWLKWRAPWFDDDDIVDAIIAAPVNFTADQAAQRIGLTFARRTALAITTIGAIDMPRKARIKLRAAKKTVRKREQRRAAGIKSRAEYEADSINRQKPWEAIGISRATYYRRSGSNNVLSFETSLTPSNSYISVGVRLVSPPVLTPCSSK
jgi:hypothetical protein